MERGADVLAKDGQGLTPLDRIPIQKKTDAEAFKERLWRLANWTRRQSYILFLRRARFLAYPTATWAGPSHDVAEPHDGENESSRQDFMSAQARVFAYEGLQREIASYI